MPAAEIDKRCIFTGKRCGTRTKANPLHRHSNSPCMQLNIDDKIRPKKREQKTEQADAEREVRRGGERERKREKGGDK